MAKNRNNAEAFVIVERLAVITEMYSDWNRELNLISWNGGEPKYDIRCWSPDHQRLGRGITLSEKEMQDIVKAVSGRF